MKIGLCEPVKPFNFYSLEEFEFQQLISKSRYFVGSFTHRQTKLTYVVKQLPFQEKMLQILKKIDKVRHSSIVPLLGVSLHKAKNGWIEGQRRRGQSRQSKQHISLLLFMERYEMNLHEYVVSRRKKNQPFSRLEINAFLLQMLSVLQRLQREGIAHRDVKPQNILYNKGSYFLCDFDDALQFLPRQKPQVDLTTVEYSSPQFLKTIRRPKEKYFDPFKLDVYALGLTLLFMCSMGRFSLEQRTDYIYESSEHSHADFIKEERRKWVSKSSEYKAFDSMLKMMLEEDEYKRDDFITLSIKHNKNKGDYDRAYSDYNKSDQKSSIGKTTASIRNKKAKKMMRAKREQQLRARQMKVYCMLSAAMMVIFILFCLV